MLPLTALALATPIWGFSLHLNATPLPAAALAPVYATNEDGSVSLAEWTSAESTNNTLMDWNRALSLATVGAMAVTGVLGFIQFGDEYGFHERRTDTACATGNDVLGGCGENVPWAHAALAGTSALLGVTTLIVSTQIDFERAARHDADWRIYETTRWVSFGLLVAQGLLGFFMSNAVRFGWADEDQDFMTLQGFAVGHMILGASALGMQAVNTALIF